MAYKVIILYQLYMPSYFLGTFTEYPYKIFQKFTLLWDKIHASYWVCNDVKECFVYNRKPVP